jgi:two-component system chemotaxis sensor kinase CheA
MDELTREFLIESQEGLDRLESGLTELEERPNDSALLAEIFRSVHTIKGTTGFLGFKRLEKLAHAGENLLGLLRDGKLAAGGPVITGLLQLLDGLLSSRPSKLKAMKAPTPMPNSFAISKNCRAQPPPSQSAPDAPALHLPNHATSPVCQSSLNHTTELSRTKGQYGGLLRAN